MPDTKKILLVSDSHGQNHNLWRILEKEKPYNIVVHCGDYEWTETEIRNKAGCDVYLVAGNNDIYGDLPDQAIFTFGSHRALVVHGHRHRLYAGLQTMMYAAKEAEADFVFFGHMHRPVQETYEGITFLNPGSVTFPRQEDRKATYMTLTYGDGPDVKITLHKM
ncbi:MAG: metallophosphoesterase [Lachnospiraceae bacterium]|nr:metallophosphoesterase [Lachnospiraceae bacterium]